MKQYKSALVLLTAFVTSIAFWGCGSDDCKDDCKGNESPDGSSDGNVDAGADGSSNGDLIYCEPGDFSPGSNVSMEVAGSVPSQTTLQAIADLAATTSVMVSELGGICRNIYMDLGVDQGKYLQAEMTEDKKLQAQAWCKLAMSKIAEVKGETKLTVLGPSAQCNGYFLSLAQCAAKCSKDGACDVGSKPPTCDGGKMMGLCNGDCEPILDRELSCEGKCSGSCSGTCINENGGSCEGKCEGVCEKQGGGGSGVDADGTCRGICKGTCHGVVQSKCEGLCVGVCSATCSPLQPSNSVRCDGKCGGSFEPIVCAGGRLKSPCDNVSEICRAYCEASVYAQTVCPAPSVMIDVQGGSFAEMVRFKSAIEESYPAILAMDAKLNALGAAVGTVPGIEAELNSIKVACIPNVLDALKDIKKNLTESGSMINQLKGAI